MKKNRVYVKIEDIRKLIADYMFTEGCSCCRDEDGHNENKKKIAKLLDVPQYDDGSGYNFGKFRTEGN